MKTLGEIFAKKSFNQRKNINSFFSFYFFRNSSMTYHDWMIRTIPGGEKKVCKCGVTFPCGSSVRSLFV